MSTPARLALSEDPSIARRPRFLTANWRTALLVTYPVLAMVLVIGMILLLAHEISRADAVAEKDPPAPPPNRASAPPDPAEPAQPAEPGFHIPDAAEMEAAFNPELVTVNEAGTGFGTLVEAETTEYADDNPGMLAEHLQQALTGTCINNLALRTTDNLAVKFWDYCYNSPAAADIADLVAFADQSGAMTVNFAHYPQNGDYTVANLVWQTSDEDTFDALTAAWEDVEMADSLDQVSFAVYGTGAIADRMEYADLDDDSYTPHVAGED